MTIKSYLANNTYIALLFVFIAFVVYANAIPNGYALDDFLVINTTTAKGISAFKEIFTYAFPREGLMNDYGYRPIVMASYAIEANLFGVNAHISHAVNIFLHALNAILLFGILVRLFPQYRSVIVLACIAFVIHPINTEVVNNLKSRDELLALAFGLIAAWAITQYFAQKSLLLQLLIPIAILLSLLSKKTGVFVFPFLGIVTYFSINKSEQPIKKHIKYLLYLFLSLLLSYAVYKYLATTFDLGEAPKFAHQNPLFFKKDISTRLGTGFYVIARYLQLFIYPHPLRYYYGENIVPIVGLFNPIAIVGMLSCMAAAIWAWWLRNKKPLLSSSLFLYITVAILTSGIVKAAPGIMAERFVYLCSFAFCLTIIYLLCDLLSKNKNTQIIGYALMLFLMMAASAKTISRNQAWADLKTLTATDMPHLENSFKGNRVYADARLIYADTLKNENFKDIKQHYEKALQIQPNDAQTIINMGTMYYAAQKYEQAMQLFMYADSISPVKRIGNLFNIAQTADSLHQIGKAVSYYKKTIQYKKNSNEANKAYNRLIEIVQTMPTEDQIFLTDQLAQIYYLSGDVQKAIDLWNKGLESQPNNQGLHYKLSNAYQELGDMAKANYHQSKIISK